MFCLNSVVDLILEIFYEVALIFVNFNLILDLNVEIWIWIISEFNPAL